MPASLLQGLEALGSDPGLLSNLKTEGVLARWPCGFAIGCSRAAYRGGVESHVGDAGQTPLGRLLNGPGRQVGLSPQ